MTDLDKLIDRLEIPWPGSGKPNEVVLPAWIIDLCAEAAAALEALRDEVARKDAALRGLLEDPHRISWQHGPDAQIVSGDAPNHFKIEGEFLPPKVTMQPTYAAYQAARAALAPKD